MKTLGEYFRGDAVKITSTLSGAVNSATIKVCDSAGTVQVNDLAMSADTSTQYSYTFQTTSSWAEGYVTVLVTVNTTTYTNKQEDRISLISTSC